jgi:hypothetical protein
VLAYGYRIDPQTKGVYVHEPEAEVVRRIYRWSTAEGWSSKRIADVLNDLKEPPAAPGRHLGGGRVSSGVWTDAQVRRLLSNPTYRGLQRWGRRSKSTIVRPDAFEMECPAIVTVQLWDEAQASLLLRRTFRGEFEKLKYPLRGKIRCGECGRVFIGMSHPGRNGKGYRYYRCGGAHRSLPGRPACQMPSVRADWLESGIWDRIQSLAGNPTDLADYLNNAAQTGELSAPVTKELEETTAQIRRLQHETRNLIEELSAEGSPALREMIKSTLEAKIAQSERLGRRQAELEAELAALEVQANLVGLAEEVLTKLSDRLTNPDAEVTWDVMQALVAGVTIEADEEVMRVESSLHIEVPPIGSLPDAGITTRAHSLAWPCTAQPKLEKFQWPELPMGMVKSLIQPLSSPGRPRKSPYQWPNQSS